MLNYFFKPLIAVFLISYILGEILENGLFQGHIQHWELWSYQIAVSGSSDQCNISIKPKLLGVLPFPFYYMNFTEPYLKGKSTLYDEENGYIERVEHTIQCSDRLHIVKRDSVKNIKLAYRFDFSYVNPEYFHPRSIQGFLYDNRKIVFYCNEEEGFKLNVGDIEDYSELKEFEFHCIGYKSYK